MKKNFYFKTYQGALAHLAFPTDGSIGRRNENDPDIKIYFGVYDDFQVDAEKIKRSIFFSRLADKTQVFPPELHPNARNRLTHTLDVVSIANYLASFLFLNSSLTQAIAYGHDIGHTPFGHLGEEVINGLSAKKFSHADMSVIILQKIANKGKGVNLCYETLKGMPQHSLGGASIIVPNGVTAEAALVMMADKISYVTSDLRDVINHTSLKISDVPRELRTCLGSSYEEQRYNLMRALIYESADQQRISFSLSEEAQCFASLRNWMYKNVYIKINAEQDRLDKDLKLKRIFSYFKSSKLFSSFNPFLLLALLTDSEARNLLSENSRDRFIAHQSLKHMLIQTELKGNNVDIFDIDLKKEEFKYYW